LLDNLSATTLVILGLLLPIALVLTIYFVAPKFFLRFRIALLLIAAAMEAFLIIQVGPLFL
jgi:hypothetical protein